MYLYLDNTTLNRGDVSNWLIGAGAMLGGILAIVFSLINFVQESSEDLQATAFYEKYIHGSKEKLIYILISINTILIIVFGVLVLGKISMFYLRIMLCVSILLIGVTISLIDYLHELTSVKVNPKKAIEYLETESINILEEIQKDANQISKIIELRNPKATKSQIRAVSLGLLHKKNFQEFADHVVDLLEISSSLASKNKISAGNRSIEAIERIILYYIKMRSNNSMISLSDKAILAFESDSHSFFTTVLEGINRLSKYLLKNDQEPQLVKIVNLYEHIIIYSLQITFTSKLPITENPISGQLIGYFKFFSQEVTKNNQLEVIFQISEALGRIGVATTSYKDYINISSVIEQIYKINYWSIYTTQVVVFDSTIDSWIKIIRALLFTDGNTFELHGKDILKNIFSAVVTVQNSQYKIYYRLKLNTLFIADLRETVRIAFYSIFEDKQKINPMTVLTFTEELSRALIDFARQQAYLERGNNYALAGFLEYTENLIIDWIIKEKDQVIIDELKSQLVSYVHLPSWFIKGKKLEIGDYRHLIQTSTVVGIRSILELKDNKLIEQSISAIKSVSDKFVDTANVSLGFDEPRVALNLSYLGALALKHNYRDLFKQTKKYILELDLKYRKKHKDALDKVSGLSSLQVVDEVLDWRDKLQEDKLNNRFQYDLIDNLLLESLDKEDIDCFIFEVWGLCDDRCSLKEEHEKYYDTHNKNVLIGELITILARYVSMNK